MVLIFKSLLINADKFLVIKIILLSLYWLQTCRLGLGIKMDLLYLLGVPIHLHFFYHTSHMFSKFCYSKNTIFMRTQFGWENT